MNTDQMKMGATIIRLLETVKNPVADRRTRGGETGLVEFEAGSQIAIRSTTVMVAGVPCPSVEMLTESGVPLKSQDIINALSKAQTEMATPNHRMAVALSGETREGVLDALIAEGMVTPEMILDACAAQAQKRAAAEVAAMDADAAQADGFVDAAAEPEVSAGSELDIAPEALSTVIDPMADDGDEGGDHEDDPVAEEVDAPNAPKAALFPEIGDTAAA